MGLKSGSDEWYEAKEHAERIMRKKAEARSSSEREKWADRGRDLADRLREEYGYGDEGVRWIINEYGLDRD